MNDPAPGVPEHSFLTRWLREPLLHFLLIGAVLFGAHAWRSRGAPSSTPSLQVRISDGDVQWLRQGWERQRQREPTREELRGLVTEFLREELLSREAREMGLEQNDTIVRRRLAQKVEFLVQDTSRLAEPAEDDLRKFHAAHPEWFSDDARVSFAQVYFKREHQADVAPALALLEGNSNPRELGDRLPIDSELVDVDQRAVASQYGVEFARSVFTLPPGAWRGPVESGFGLHLVRVSAQTPGRQRDFVAVRAQVLERWRDERQREDNEKYFAGLLKKYDVIVDESVKGLVGGLGAKEVAR